MFFTLFLGEETMHTLSRPLISGNTFYVETNSFAKASGRVSNVRWGGVREDKR